VTAEDRIDPAGRAALLALARASMRAAARRRPPDSVPPPADRSPVLDEKRGAFVTLHLAGRLRGCVGTLKPESPLWEAVRDAAWSSACEDNRFPPVGESECGEIDIEISVLSPMKEIPSWNEFLPGDHGILLAKDSRQAVFLPKVATDMKWGREETLSALCKKAGLPVNAWRLPGARFWIFTAEVFTDKK